MDSATMHKSIRQTWDTDILPSLVEYVAIPALSPAFDADWARTGSDGQDRCLWSLSHQKRA